MTDPAFCPSRTELCRTLRQIRRRYLLQGGRLLTADEIDEDLTARRGERKSPDRFEAAEAQVDIPLPEM